MQFGKKLFVMAMAAIFIVACLIPFSFEPAMADANISWADWNNSSILPQDNGGGVSCRLTRDVTLSETWIVPTGDPVNLDLNGHVIKMTGTGSVITVPNDATLNLYDSKA